VLYVTRPPASTTVKNGREFLDGDNKLSSAGAAASLKYAQPKDLPSYPSSGLRKNDTSAAGAAASLGWANQKSFEHWKPDPSVSASAAAMMAKDYKMAPLWQPEQSANGAKAALLAHRDAGKVEIWTPEPSVAAWGNSAANQAFKKDRAGGLSPQLDYGHTALGRQGSLLAATGAMSRSRKRAESTPIIPRERYPDEANAVSNALSAATVSHSQSQKRINAVSDSKGASPFTNMPREMFTSNPPVKPEVDERNRQDTLHASAVAMAKQMYTHQQKQIEQVSAAQSGAMAAHRRPSSAASSVDEAQPMRFHNLQEAAQKLAQERLAKLHDEHAKNREYRDYYGSTSTPSKLSIRGRVRRRASSDGSLDQDRAQSNKIRAQMSIFSSNLTQVDEKKRQQDREALIAAAQRNVTKSLHGMDQKVFADTGKVAPSLLSEWEVKAHAAAQAKSDNRMENHGRIHIGGGKFINQSEVDLVAARNVQPVLDEINEKAEAERERQAIIKLEQETQQRKTAEEKTREKERREIDRKLKQQEKDERKAREAEDKATKTEEKRIEKEKRKSLKSDSAPTASTVANAEAAAPSTVETVEGTPDTTTAATSEIPASEPTISERCEVPAPAPLNPRTSMEEQASLRMQETADAANRDEVTPMSPTSPKDGSKVKNWLKNKFNRRSLKAQKPSSSSGEKESGFVGGATLTGASVNGSTNSLGARSGSAREVAMAREPSEERGRTTTQNRDSVVSSLSGNGNRDEDEEFQEARDNFDEDLVPPPTFVADKGVSPSRAGKFIEEI
jgi:hypothetical protein